MVLALMQREDVMRIRCGIFAPNGFLQGFTRFASFLLKLFQPVIPMPRQTTKPKSSEEHEQRRHHAWRYLTSHMDSLLQDKQAQEACKILIKEMEKQGFEFFSPGGSTKRRILYMLSLGYAYPYDLGEYQPVIESEEAKSSFELLLSRAEKFIVDLQ